MIKVWFMLALISVPNVASIKYNGFLYMSEEECQFAKYEFLEAYHQKPFEYKVMTKMNAYCVEFESFPLLKKEKEELKKPTNDIKA